MATRPGTPEANVGSERGRRCLEDSRIQCFTALMHLLAATPREQRPAVIKEHCRREALIKQLDAKLAEAKAHGKPSSESALDKFGAGAGTVEGVVVEPGEPVGRFAAAQVDADGLNIAAAIRTMTREELDALLACDNF